MLGSAVVKGQATEIIDVGHFLPLAFEDWFRRKDVHGHARARRAAGRRFRLLPQHARPGAEGRRLRGDHGAGRATTRSRCSRAASVFDVVVTDIEMPGMNGFELAEAMRGDPRTAELPIIGLSSLVSPEAIERGRKVGFHDYVAKFDRPGTHRGAQGADRGDEPGGVRRTMTHGQRQPQPRR